MSSALIAAAGIDYGTGIIGWIIIGLIAGALAGLVMRGGGFGIIGDIVVGIIGALIGGFILSLFGLGASGFWSTLITAFIGACILIAILRAVSGNRVTA
ncbi:MAG TPA: GlsB/YeaQ/YmgE family stress response membrane protein [Chloroflexota bacterium]|nr:GlsB/YeaQ/YmgE family stress response membrane protein [Chloroflexota bacterium]